MDRKTILIRAKRITHRILANLFENMSHVCGEKVVIRWAVIITS